MQPYLASVFVCLLSWLHSSIAQNYMPMQTISGKIGGGNYTYYKLQRSGNIRIKLTSLQGDADIYVSQASLHPTYDLENFDYQSATCGDEIVDIPENFKRPVGIGIYGHPRHMQSIFECQILIELTGDAVPNPETYWNPTHGDVEEEPLLWTIFVNVLKVIIDILV